MNHSKKNHSSKKKQNKKMNPQKKLRKGKIKIKKITLGKRGRNGVVEKWLVKEERKRVEKERRRGFVWGRDGSK